jgi:hypothetical protein
MPMPTLPFARLAAFRSELHTCFTRRADALFELATRCCAPRRSPRWPSSAPSHPTGAAGAAPTMRWPAGASLSTGRATCRCASCRPPTRRCSPSMSPPGRAATPSARLRAATTTTPRGTRPASRSSPAGPGSGLPSSASPAIPGPPRWTRPGYIPWRTPTSKPLGRSARCLSGCLPVDCFYADPPPRPPGSTDRPRRHGAKCNLADPTTWPAPTADFGRRPAQHVRRVKPQDKPRSALGSCRNGRSRASAVTNGHQRSRGTAGRRPSSSNSSDDARGRFELWSRRSGRRRRGSRRAATGVRNDR